MIDDDRISDGPRDFDHVHFTKWAYGVVLPVLISLYAIYCIATQHAVLPGRHATLDIVGTPAVLQGIAYLSVAAYLHFRYLWIRVERLLAYSDVGRIASLLCFIGSFGYVLWHIATD